MSSTQTLNSATQARKARLAQLQSLKRKQPPTDDNDEPTASRPSAAKSPRHDTSSTPEPQPLQRPEDTQPEEDEEEEDEGDQPTLNPHLSHRNYDPATKTARLGFESTPTAGTTTNLELRAAALATQAKAEATAAEATSSAPLDLFTLQPKKPNWDLKRDLERKMAVLGVRTDNAIARLVRERVRKGKGGGANGEGGVVGEAGALGSGLEGSELVEALNVREREAEEEERREREVVEGIGGEEV